MKKIALIAALSFALPAWSQEAKPPAEPAKPAAQEAPKAEAPKAQAPKAEAGKDRAPRKVHPARRQEDARHCLEKGSNTEIIKCAEAYL